jgi:hypothetical protein
MALVKAVWYEGTGDTKERKRGSKTTFYLYAKKLSMSTKIRIAARYFVLGRLSLLIHTHPIPKPLPWPKFCLLSKNVDLCQWGASGFCGSNCSVESSV